MEMRVEKILEQLKAACTNILDVYKRQLHYIEHYAVSQKANASAAYE